MINYGENEIYKNPIRLSGEASDNRLIRIISKYRFTYLVAEISSLNLMLHVLSAQLKSLNDNQYF